MIFELVSKGQEEPIDRVDMANVGVAGAKTYFMGRKQLPEEEFDKIYEVKSAPSKQAYVGNIIVGEQKKVAVKRKRKVKRAVRKKRK